jgi:hypothetical protein
MEFLISPGRSTTPVKPVSVLIYKPTLDRADGPNSGKESYEEMMVVESDRSAQPALRRTV